MRNITLKCLLAVLFVSEVLAIEDPEAILKELLEDYADVKPVCTTPVKTKVVRGDIVSPMFKKSIADMRKKELEFGNAKEIIEALKIRLTEKDAEIAMLKEEILNQNKTIMEQTKEINTLHQILSNVQNALIGK